MIAAVADLEGSATLVAVTVNVPGVVSAVNKPEAEILPPVAVHVTPVLALPVTLAVNCCVDPEATVVVAGEMEMVTVVAPGFSGVVAAVTPPQPVFRIVATTKSTSSSRENNCERCIRAHLIAVSFETISATVFSKDALGRVQ